MVEDRATIIEEPQTRATKEDGATVVGEAEAQDDDGRRVLFETDWLASDPVFYHEATGRASRIINDVIDLENLEFDPAGFNNYLDFGYSVFGRTPVKGVRFLPPSSRLVRDRRGALRIEPLQSPVERYLGRVVEENELIDLIAAKIRRWEDSADGAIVVPTSGGLDSRLLNLLVADTSRIRAFTYGTTEPQSDSYEVRRARALAGHLGTRWEHVELGDFHRYFDEWDSLYGVSTHAHGMYQIEFYRKIRERLGGPALVVSGSCGDWFAGSSTLKRECVIVRRPEDLLDCLIVNPTHADSSMSRFEGGRDVLSEFFEVERQACVDPLLRVIEIVRSRTILLSYLLRVPESLGFRAFAPYLDPEIALAMLSLPAERRYDRRWQRDYYDERGVGLDDVSGAWHNTLSFQALRRVPVWPLSERLLGEVVRPDYVRWVNRNVGRRGIPWEWYARLRFRPGFRRLMKAPYGLGLRDQRSPAYYAYLCLRPIEALLRRREAARRLE
jgi:asparagine synthetase B (glutamine-hydrolysing)